MLARQFQELLPQFPFHSCPLYLSMLIARPGLLRKSQVTTEYKGATFAPILFQNICPLYFSRFANI